MIMVARSWVVQWIALSGRIHYYIQEGVESLLYTRMSMPKWDPSPADIGVRIRIQLGSNCVVLPKKSSLCVTAGMLLQQEWSCLVTKATIYAVSWRSATELIGKDQFYRQLFDKGIDTRQREMVRRHDASWSICVDTIHGFAKVT